MDLFVVYCPTGQSMIAEIIREHKQETDRTHLEHLLAQAKPILAPESPVDVQAVHGALLSYIQHVITMKQMSRARSDVSNRCFYSFCLLSFISNESNLDRRWHGQ